MNQVTILSEERDSIEAVAAAASSVEAVLGHVASSVEAVLGRVASSVEVVLARVASSVEVVLARVASSIEAVLARVASSVEARRASRRPSKQWLGRVVRGRGWVARDSSLLP